MGSTYRQKGDTWEYTNGSGSDIAVNSVVVMGDTVGIAEVDIADGETGAVAVTGVHEVAKAAGTAWDQGAKLDWDASTDSFDVGVTAATGDVEDCGVAAEAAASADTTGYIRLTPGTGTGA
ncbi:MAG TPA: DUF2190 family protein [Longimicrobiales bacterium]|nr:DUF2190 family protein [Longimicrobiales bacterium]